MGCGGRGAASGQAESPFIGLTHCHSVVVHGETRSADLWLVWAQSKHLRPSDYGDSGWGTFSFEEFSVLAEKFVTGTHGWVGRGFRSMCEFMGSVLGDGRVP